MYVAMKNQKRCKFDHDFPHKQLRSDITIISQIRFIRQPTSLYGMKFYSSAALPHNSPDESSIDKA